jgi:hypothetical protein
MGERRRCPRCRRLFTADPRVGDRQRTCGSEACRRQHKREYDGRWRGKHPDYFRGGYAQQKEIYGSRAEDQRRYRRNHPDYGVRHAAYMRAWRQRRAEDRPVSDTSCDMRVTISEDSSYLEITRVSHTSREILVTLCKNETLSTVTA